MKNFLCIIKKSLLMQRGQVAVIVALIIVSLLGMTALVIDVGSLYQKRGFFQTVADSAALAGAQELPESPEGAFLTAVDYADRNNVDIIYIYDCRDYSSEEIKISSTYSPNDTITVTLANREAPLYFAKVFGKDTVPISAGAKAMAGSPVELYYAVPWAAVIPDGESWESWLEMEAGEEKIISDNEDESDFIAWDTTDHPGQWNQRYRNRIINGYDEPLKEGDSIFIREINIAQTVNGVEDRINVWDNFNDLVSYINYGDGNIIKLSKNDDQFVIIPLIYEYEVEEWSEIVAFAPFIITEIRSTGPGHGHGSKTQVIGRFIHQVLIVSESEEIGPAREVGFKVIRLVE